MSNETHGISLRATGIALLGASTILLAAAGETMWHANANASEGRWAGPGVGVATALPVAAETPGATASAVALEAESEMMTTPIFKPFVMVRIPLPSGYSKGEVLGINDAGQAVGWMYNTSAGFNNAFYFDPASGVTILDTDAVNMDEAGAYSISNGSTPLIVGYVEWKDNPNYLRAGAWDGSQDEAYVPFGTGVVSTAFGANATTFVGAYVNSSQWQSIAYNKSTSTTYYPASGSEGEALAINPDGKAVGWYMTGGDRHAYWWEVNSATDLHPTGSWVDSAALAVNKDGDIVGWVSEEEGVDDNFPALWLDTGFGVHTFNPFTAIGASSRAVAINSELEILITRDDGTPGAALWTRIGSNNYGTEIDDLVLTRDSADTIETVTCMNDNLWIGGSYLEGGTGDPQPCLIIPYDVNNDGEPDYREIIFGKSTGQTDVDTNNNWLLDWAEHLSGNGMRVGLHAPGQEASSHGILYNQIVRMPLRLRSLAFDDENPGSDPDEYPLDEILTDSTLCCTFQQNINDWTRTSGSREIVFWLRSSLGTEAEGDYDFLPEYPIGFDADDLLADIHNFGYKFARCIDYVKTGNEVFGGAGGYKFYSDQLSECSWSGGTSRRFDQLDNGCKDEAATKVLDWLERQAWAALDGSALAGRPLRIIGPGIQSTVIRNGYPSGNYNTNFEDLMQEVTPWCNRNQIYFDIHVLYTSLGEAEESIEKFTGTGTTWTNPSWDDANWAVCMELGPIVIGGQWATNNSTRFDDFVDCVDNEETWWDFVGRWKTDQFDGVTDFGIPDAIAACAAPGDDSSRAFAAVCYGPTIQHPEPIFFHDMGALRATNVCAELIGEGQGSTRYTPLRGMYQNAADNYTISSFSPHPNACTACQCN